jgi:hypothetical protein
MKRRSTPPLKKVAATPREVSELYGLSRGHLANLRSKSLGPRYFKRGRMVLYWLTDVETYLRECPCMTADAVQQK